MISFRRMHLRKDPFSDDMRQKSRQIDGFDVEMRGIEPRSEEKTIRTPTSIVFPNSSLTSPGEDSSPASYPRKNFAPRTRENLETIRAKSTPCCSSPGEATKDGML